MATQVRPRIPDRGIGVTAQAIAPAWMHEPVTAEQHDSWSAEQSAGIEIADPPGARAHGRRGGLARIGDH